MAKRAAAFEHVGKGVTLDFDLEDRRSDYNPEALTERVMTKEELHRALRRLPEEHQQVLLLRFVEGLGHSEVARLLGKSEGAVQVYFVAFDTSPQKFAFLKQAGGDVIGAGTGGELRQALDGIYRGKILAEAPGAGEREPDRK